MIAIVYQPFEAEDDKDEESNDITESDAIVYQPFEAEDDKDEESNDITESDANPAAADPNQALEGTEDAFE